MAQLLKISLFLLCIVSLHNSSAIMDEFEKKMIKKAMKTLGKLPGILGQAFELYEMFENVSSMFTPGDGPQDTDDRLDMIIDKLDELSSDMKDFESRLMGQLDKDSKADTLDRSLKEFHEPIAAIDRLYNEFVDYVNDTLVFRESQIKTFVDTVTRPDGEGVNSMLTKMHTKFIRSEGKSKTIPSFLLDGGITPEFMCAFRQSPQQIIHTLYQKILLSEVKGYAMLMFSNEILNAIENVTETTSNKQQAINRFKDRMNETFKRVKTSMKYASREIRGCDPSHPVEKRDYARFGPVFQKNVIFEKEAHDIKKKEQYSCFGSCKEFKLVGHKCEDSDRVCESHHCHGNVRGCEDKGADLSYCLANDKYRRYQYLEIGDKNYGQDKTCENDLVAKSAYSYWIFYRCSYCICTCEDTRNSIDKHVSLRPVFSDYKNNKVVTGVRIRLIKHIFYIQIKQGVLLANGRIDPTTEDWKKVDNFTIWDKNIQKDIDYYDITWDTKSICLDDVDSKSSPYKKKHVLTGLQFQKVDNKLQLSVHLSKFNFDTGNVVKNKNNPKLHYIEPEERSIFSLDKFDVPTRYKNPDPRPAEGQCFELTTSDFSKDAGQNVLPFIDIQPIEVSPPVPLSGAGLFLRSDNRDESGGYLALKLFTLNLEPFMKQPEAEKNLRGLED